MYYIAMERTVFQQLNQWKSSPRRKPLILQGARQVGKNWVMREFGRRSFKNTAYVNFDNNAAMKRLFEGDFDIPRLVLALSAQKCRSRPAAFKTRLSNI